MVTGRERKGEDTRVGKGAVEVPVRCLGPAGRAGRGSCRHTGKSGEIERRRRRRRRRRVAAARRSAVGRRRCRRPCWRREEEGGSEEKEERKSRGEG